MEGESTITQSLQEIAQLLLIIHEKYITGTTNREILTNLITFIRAIGLDNQICILDIEYYRKKVMYDDKKDTMGYESFYVWLKQIASHVFRFDSPSKNDKRSFHNLLTKHIIPFASNSHVKLGKIDNVTDIFRWLQTIDNRSLETFVENRDLLKLWYMNILAQDGGFRLTPIDLSWKILHEMNSEVLISSNHLLTSLKCSDICPTYISTNKLLQTFRDITHRKSTNEIAISFLQFLSILNKISDEILDSTYQGDYSGNSRLRTLFIHFSVTSIRRVIESYASDLSSKASAKTVTVSSMLWLLRQSGLTQLESIHFNALIEQIELEAIKLREDHSLRKLNQTEPKEIEISHHQVPVLVSRLIHKSMRLEVILPNNTDSSEETFTSWVVFIAYYLPGTLFATFSKQSTMKALSNLYTSSMIRMIGSNYSLWENSMNSYFKYRLSQAKTPIDDMSSMGWTIQSFIEYAEFTSFIPKVISVEKFREMARYIIWPFGQQPSCLETLNMPINDLLDTLFAISQQLISRQQNVPLSGDNISFMSFRIVLEKFQSPTDNTNIDASIATAMKSVISPLTSPSSTKLTPFQPMDFTSPIRSKESDSSIDMTPVKVEKSMSTPFLTPQITLSPNLPVKSIKKTIPESKPLDIDRSMSASPEKVSILAEIDQGQLLNEAMMLLIFFPLQSFHLSPWEISQIFIAANAIDRCRNKDSIDAKLLLSRIFSMFCDKYQILPDNLAKFYSLRYEDPLQSPSTSISKVKGLTILKPSIVKIMNDPILKLMLVDKILKLLYANADLFKWEYCRILSKCSSMRLSPSSSIDALFDYSSPYPLSIDWNPITPCQQSCSRSSKVYSEFHLLSLSKYYLLPKSIAIHWAVEISRISVTTANQFYDLIDDCCIEYRGKGLTFSAFIMYAIKCFTYHSLIQQRIELANKSKSSDEIVSDMIVSSSTSLINIDLFMNLLRDLLMKLSEPLTKLQQSLRIRILNPMFNGFPIDNPPQSNHELSPRYRSTILSPQDIATILNLAINQFRQYCESAFSLNYYSHVNKPSKFSIPKIEISTFQSTLKFLPPRPPDMFLDAPRYIAFCRLHGITHSLGISSMACCWYAYGAYLRSLSPPSINNWPETVVPPLPMKFDSQSIILLMEHLVDLSLDDSMLVGWSMMEHDGYTKGFQFLLSKVVLPVICARAQRQDDVNTMTNTSTEIVSQSQSLLKNKQDSLMIPLSFQYYIHSMNSSMEDLFRYGGDQVVVSMDTLRPWILSIYQMCIKEDIDQYSYNVNVHASFDSFNSVENRTIIEPSLKTVCKYFSCSGLLLESTILSLAKLSLQPRIRPCLNYQMNSSSMGQDTQNIYSSNNQSEKFPLMNDYISDMTILNNLTLSITEVEELFVRCGFVLWELCGAAGKFSLSIQEFLIQHHKQYAYTKQMLNMLQSPVISADLGFFGYSVQSINDLIDYFQYNQSILLYNNEDALKKIELIGNYYCDECHRVASERNQMHEQSPYKMNSTTPIRSTWGVDYIKPYYNVLRKHGGFDINSLQQSLDKSTIHVDATGLSNSQRSGTVNMNLLEAHLEMKATHDMTAMKSSTKTASSILSTLNSLDLNISMTKQKLYRDRYSNITNSPPKVIPSSARVNEQSLRDSLSITIRPGSSTIVTPIKKSSETIQNSQIDTSNESKYNLLSDHYDHFIADPVIRQKDSQNALTKLLLNASNALSDSSRDTNEQSFITKSNQFLDNMNKNIKNFEDISQSSTPPRSIDRGQNQRSSNDMHASLPISYSNSEDPLKSVGHSQTNVNPKLLEYTKEQLWPVYATYCSCGDSNEPGKLSGPNLFALLSKLGLLTDLTVLSDVGILLHQISSHSHSQSSLGIGMIINSINQAINPSEGWGDSPSLTFEEFLIFLCAFSQLRYHGEITAPIFNDSVINVSYQSQSIQHKKNHNNQIESKSTNTSNQKWFENWQQYMSTSESFSRLLEECIVPVLTRYPVLASPDDARMRDKYSLIFSLEVLLAIEGAEQPLLSSFESERNILLSCDVNSSINNISAEKAFDSILLPLQRMNLVPQIMTVAQIRQLIIDIVPNKQKSHLNDKSPTNTTTGSSSGQSSITSGASIMDGHIMSMLKFPTWEWIVAVVACQAVEIAVMESTIPTDPLKIPSLLANLIASIASAVRVIQHSRT